MCFQSLSKWLCTPRYTSRYLRKLWNRKRKKINRRKKKEKHFFVSILCPDRSVLRTSLCRDSTASRSTRWRINFSSRRPPTSKFPCAPWPTTTESVSCMGGGGVWGWQRPIFKFPCAPWPTARVHRSVRRSVWSVTLSLIGLLGAT